jgi:hypothetical protein
VLPSATEEGARERPREKERPTLVQPALPKPLAQE